MIDVLAAEWLKLRTIRSTYHCLGAMAVVVGLMAALALYAAHFWDGLPPAQRAHFALAPLPDLACWVAYLVMGILGVLTITSEYATGMIAATLTAVPRRRRVLLAKAVVVGAVALAAGQAAGFGSFAASRLIIGGRPIQGQEAHPGQVVVLGVLVMVFALVGLAVGELLRSTAGAIAVLAGLWYGLPVLLQALPSPWDRRVGSVMPAALADEIAGTGGGGRHSIYGTSLPPVAALIVLVAYAVVPLGAAVLAMERRDV